MVKLDRSQQTEREENTMKITIENITSCRIAYLRNTGAYGANNIQAMAQIKDWAKANGLMGKNTIILGIAHDNPQTTPPEKCRYDACVILPNKPFMTEDSMQYREMEGGKYAIFTVKHTAKAMAQAWGEIFPALSLEGHILDHARPILERYAAKKVAQHLCEICIPIY